MIGENLKGLSLLIAAGFLMGCTGPPGRPSIASEIPRPDAVLDFPTLYGQNCAGCHGNAGKDGPAYPIASPLYDALVDEPTLRQYIAAGEPGTLMPAFAQSAGGSLTDQQVDSLVRGMRSAWFKPDALQGSHPPAYRSVTTGDPVRGAAAYAQYCASCHRNETAAASITGKPFLALVSDQALRTVIIAGRSDLGQPDWREDLHGHPLTDAEVTDIVAWLSQQRSGTMPGGSK